MKVQIAMRFDSRVCVAALVSIASLSLASLPASLQQQQQQHQPAPATLRVLQTHIDELTTEKLELMRGLQQQAKVAEGMAEEMRGLEARGAELTASLEAERKRARQQQEEVRQTRVPMEREAQRRFYLLRAG